MIWWLRARSAQLLALVTAGSCLFTAVVGEAAIPIPIITGQAGLFLAVHIIAAVPTVTYLYGIDRGDQISETVASRDLKYWDLALAWSMIACLILIATVYAIVGDAPVGWLLARNASGFLGLGLVLHTLVGARIAGVLVVTVPLACAAAGWGPGGRPMAWAWPLHPAESLFALTVAGVLLLVGSTATLLHVRPLLRVDLALP